MRRRSLLRIRSVSYGGCWSMRLKRRPLLQTSSPLNHQLRTYIGIGTANGGTSGAADATIADGKRCYASTRSFGTESHTYGAARARRQGTPAGVGLSKTSRVGS